VVRLRSLETSVMATVTRERIIYFMCWCVLCSARGRKQLRGKLTLEVGRLGIVSVGLETAASDL
jgi:hypothetical protein